MSYSCKLSHCRPLKPNSLELTNMHETGHNIMRQMWQLLYQTIIISDNGLMIMIINQ